MNADGGLLRRRTGPATATAVATVVSLAAAGLAAGASYASGSAVPPAAAAPRALLGSGPRDPYVDITTQDGRAVTRSFHRQSEVSRTPAVRAFRAVLPAHALLDLSGTTGTVRFLGDLDGFLTAPSARSPRGIVLRYVRHHAAGLGLVPSDVDTLSLARDYRDIAGIHHLYFTQRIDGRRVARNGLTAAVDRSGRLLTLGGSPVSTADRAPTTAPTTTTATAALALARGSGARSTDTGEDSARRVLYATGSGLHRAWQTTIVSTDAPATTILDAVTGQVLLRTPYTQFEHSTGRAYRFFPGAHRGGRQVTVDFTKKGWLGSHARRLSGNNAHAYSDVNDDNAASRSEEVGPRGDSQSWGYRLTAFHPGFASSFCSHPWPCSWNPDRPYSWRTNRAQNATQVFYLVNAWHDHLARSPIGFSEAAGNFQDVNHTRRGRGRDAVIAQTDDGANTGVRGLPDAGHVDNANMTTPPDGRHPTMQMYLQHLPGTSYPGGDPFAPTNVGDEADTVYHEYTHGLSNRLVVDVDGRSTLGDGQAGAMGEGWSDWYAMDYLVDQRLQPDRPDRADVRLFAYDGAGSRLDRTEPIDCAVGSTYAPCTGGRTGHRGGYTYADYGSVAGEPEVHSDGEIWGQTLWDVRAAIGSRAAESLVTRAMELAPYDPSFVDMRNAILIADHAVFAGRHTHRIWRVFARRGMGYFAGSLGGDDASPAASFAMPPDPSTAGTTTGTITGTVTDADTGAPLSGVPVTLAFDGSGPANPTAVTGADGRYTIPDVPTGDYAKLVVQAAGYEPDPVGVAVPFGGSVTRDFLVRRDWAAASGGATASSPDGGDDFAGCGLRQAIDLDRSTVWSTSTSTGADGFRERSLVVDLRHPVDISAIAVDPTAGCGDDPSSSIGGYTLFTSPDAESWTEAARGAFTAADLDRLNELTPAPGSAGAVRYVELTVTGNQTPDYATACHQGLGSYSGCTYTDLAELEVYGTPSS